MRQIEFPDGSFREYPNGIMLWPIYPRQIRIEPVYGCDKRCGFCSLAVYSSKTPAQFMTEALFYNCILEKHKREQLNVIGLSGTGEPTMHPLFFDFVRAFRRFFPKAGIRVISNGFLFRKAGDLSPLATMLEAGATSILIDCYDKETLQIVEKEKDDFGICNCYDKSVWESAKRKIIAYNPMDQANFEHTVGIRRPDTQGGMVPYSHWEKYNINPMMFPVLKRCAECNRAMHITVDGKVNVCCLDGSRSFFIGDLQEQTPREIWQSRDYDIVRYFMRIGRRDLFPMCYLCDRRSFRLGLYPHAGGKYTKEDAEQLIVEKFRPSEAFKENISAFGAKNEIRNETLKRLVQA